MWPMQTQIRLTAPDEQWFYENKYKMYIKNEEKYLK